MNVHWQKSIYLKVNTNEVDPWKKGAQQMLPISSRDFTTNLEQASEKFCSEYTAIEYTHGLQPCNISFEQ